VLPSFLEVLGVPAELPPDGGQGGGQEEHQTAGHQVGDGQEVVLPSQPRHRGQNNQLPAPEGLRGEVWNAPTHGSGKSNNDNMKDT